MKMIYHTERKDTFVGIYYQKYIITDDGKKYDFAERYLYPQNHHKIITTEDGYKLALNPHIEICYLICGYDYD